MDAASSPVDPPLSIVIPCHQRTDLLRRCLATVSDHAPKGSEIIVVDDASPFGSATAVAADFPGVRSIRMPTRRGFAAAANCGIEAARSAIVELLNDDTEVEAGWATAALRCFADSSVAAVAPLVIKLDGKTVPVIDSAGDGYHIGGFARKLEHGRRVSATSMSRRVVFGASASSAFYRRDLLLRVGVFPESFGSYFEDVDLSFRLQRAGGRILFEPQSRVWHHVHASYGLPDRRLAELQSRNEERVFWRNVPASEWASALPMHAAVLIAKGFRRLREGTFIPFVMGRLRAFLEVREFARHRRAMSRLSSGSEWTALLSRNWNGI